MADIANKNVFRGTRQSYSLGDIKDHRATRLVRVTGLDNDANDNGDAIAQFISEEGVNHNDISGLPLASVSSQKRSLTEAWVTANYHLHAASPPTLPSFQMVDESFAGYIKLRKVTINENANDYTVGTTTIRHDTATIRYVKAPLWRIRVPVVLETNPLGAALVSDAGKTFSVDLPGRINSDSMTLGGVARAAKTLRFNGFSYRVLHRVAGPLYVGAYMFTWCPLGWVNENLSKKWDPISVDSRMWIQSIYTKLTYDLYDTEVFTGNFPANT